METTIKIFRLNSGEDIIAEIERKDHLFKVTNPIVFMLRNDNRTGSQVVNMTFWLPVSLMEKNQTIIDSKDVIAMMDPSADFAEYYLGAVENINNSKTSFKTSNDEKEELTDEDKMALLEMMSVGNSTSVMH
jgi:hypothetical protein